MVSCLKSTVEGLVYSIDFIKVSADNYKSGEHGQEASCQLWR